MEQYLESEHQRELEIARRQRLKIEQEELRRNMPSTPTPPVSVPDPTPDRPVGGSWFDSGFGKGIAGVGVLVAIFVVAFIVLYLFYLFIGVILGNEITAIVVLGVGLFVFCLSQWDDDSIFMYLIIALAYGLLLFFVVWASGADRPPPDLGEDCRIEDRGGRIREICW